MKEILFCVRSGSSRVLCAADTVLRTIRFNLSEQPSRRNVWTFEKETEVRLI